MPAADISLAARPRPLSKVGPVAAFILAVAQTGRRSSRKAGRFAHDETRIDTVFTLRGSPFNVGAEGGYGRARQIQA